MQRLLLLVVCAALACADEPERTVTSFDEAPEQPTSPPVTPPEVPDGGTQPGPFPAHPLERLDGEREVLVVATKETTKQQDGSWLETDHTGDTPFPAKLDVVPLLDGRLRLVNDELTGSFYDPSRGGPVAVTDEREMFGRETIVLNGYAGLDGWVSFDWRVKGSIDPVNLSYALVLEIGSGATEAEIVPVYRLELSVTGVKRYQDLLLTPTEARRAHDGAMLGWLEVDPGDCRFGSSVTLNAYDLLAQSEDGSSVMLTGINFLMSASELMLSVNSGRVEESFRSVSIVWEEGMVTGSFGPTGPSLNFTVARYETVSTPDGAKRGPYVCAYAVQLDGRYRYESYNAHRDSTCRLDGERNAQVVATTLGCSIAQPGGLRLPLDLQRQVDGQLVLTLGSIRTVPFLPRVDGSFNLELNYIPHDERIRLEGWIKPDLISFSLEVLKRDAQGNPTCVDVYQVDGFRRYLPHQ